MSGSDPPKCRLCGDSHWTWQPHNLPPSGGKSPQQHGKAKTDRVERPRSDASKGQATLAPAVTKLSVTKPEPVTKPRGGRPKVHATAAERQKAYRKRRALA